MPLRIPMNLIEIERKFLVKEDSFKDEAKSCDHITQGFLSSHPKRVVRVRLINDKGFLTVKGKSKKNSFTRFEWEREINREEATALLNLCEKGVIEKKRYYVEVGKHMYEVDEFLGKNKGLTIAEVELQSEEEEIIKPTWLGKEVTGKKRYYNSQLSKKPFTTWKN